MAGGHTCPRVRSATGPSVNKQWSTPDTLSPGLQAGRDYLRRGGDSYSAVCTLSSPPTPVQLVKTADLDPRHNYVVGFHPHGVLVAGAFTNFCTYATGFRQLFPGVTSYLLMLPLWFRAPFFRDYIMCAGVGREPRVKGPTALCLRLTVVTPQA